MIVGVSGVAGAGKSEVASHLQRRGFTVVSFADPIKRIVADLFGFTEHQLNGPSSARSEPHPTLKRPDGTPLTARFALQTLGTDWGRMCCPNVWVDRAMREVRERGGDVAIGDVRFLNEVEAIRAAGGKLIRRKTTRPVTDMHPTEQALASLPDSAFDACIPRLDSLDQLHATIDILLSGWRSESAP